MAASLDSIFRGWKCFVSLVGSFFGSSLGFVYLGTKNWNSELIDSQFLQWEADYIKSIPLSAHIHFDLLIWPYTSDGCYSVQSAYCLLAAAQSRDLPSSSNVDASKMLWKGVWSVEVPNKVRYFI